jgi:hypothetical protein
MAVTRILDEEDRQMLETLRKYGLDDEVRHYEALLRGEVHLAVQPEPAVAAPTGTVPLAEAAARLGLPRKEIRRYVESGLLQAEADPTTDAMVITNASLTRLLETQRVLTIVGQSLPGDIEESLNPDSLLGPDVYRRRRTIRERRGGMTEPQPPRAFSGTPTPPPGDHDLRLTGASPLRVFVDTSVYFHKSYQLALAASVLAGDLAVFWSDEIQAEISRVVERAAATAEERRVAYLPDNERAAGVAVALARIRLRINSGIELLRRYFDVAPAIPVDAAAELTDVVDADDRLHVLAARAAEALYLLTLDGRYLPHGAVFVGVQCWHPDTFLTLFYRQNPDAYLRARQSIELLPEGVAQGLMP